MTGNARALVVLASVFDFRSKVRTLLSGMVGIERLALIAQKTKNGESVSLRPAVPGDLMLLYGWQTHPSTRKYARNPQPPTLAEHCEWFYKHLGSADCMILIILLGDKAAGCLRLDRLADARLPAWELSINIAPEYVRLGLARAALRLAQTAIPGAELIAHVMPRNHASHALFKAAGFQHGSDGCYRFVCAN